MQNISRLFFSCSWNWPLAMAPGGCVQCMYNVHTLNMLCWCMSRGFLWAGVAAFPCHQQSHLQGEVSLPLPAPSSNSFKCRTFEQNLDPLETILWQFWRLSWVLCIFLQHNFQYVPLDPPELISTLVIHMWKNAKLLGDNFGTLQKKRRFILRGIPWIGTFSGLLFLWGLNPNSVFTDQIRLPPITNCHQSPHFHACTCLCSWPIWNQKQKSTSKVLAFLYS